MSGKTPEPLEKNSALFICLGNICRSPIAEAVFRHLVKERGIEDKWVIDSAATGNWHTGGSPDDRAMRVLKSNGITYSHIVRQIGDSDFEEFQWIFGMDDDNISDIKEVAPPGHKSKILLLGSFDPKGETEIRDPYYDRNDKGFFKCYEQCLRDCNAFLDEVMGKTP
ncbi:unnamed protein product [Allacma fusca]|uniref:Phosphotyrosine protein phosphatase I domain-containing protein n=1 Tax=Allacma fusca TaxID=39272 RepID=A0A8J2KJL5_9HEXA|nr:unnamed protein product [Allacma fusca]